MNKLKAIRYEQNIASKEMAEALGVSLSCYSLKENGKRAITVEEALLIARILKKPIEKIFYL